MNLMQFQFLLPFFNPVLQQSILYLGFGVSFVFLTLVLCEEPSQGKCARIKGDGGFELKYP